MGSGLRGINALWSLPLTGIPLFISQFKDKTPSQKATNFHRATFVISFLTPDFFPCPFFLSVFVVAFVLLSCKIFIYTNLCKKWQPLQLLLLLLANEMQSLLQNLPLPRSEVKLAQKAQKKVAAKAKSKKAKCRRQLLPAAKTGDSWWPQGRSANLALSKCTPLLGASAHSACTCSSLTCSPEDLASKLPNTNNSSFNLPLVNKLNCQRVFYYLWPISHWQKGTLIIPITLFFGFNLLEFNTISD